MILYVVIFEWLWQLLAKDLSARCQIWTTKEKQGNTATCVLCCTGVETKIFGIMKTDQFCQCKKTATSASDKCYDLFYSVRLMHIYLSQSQALNYIHHCTKSICSQVSAISFAFFHPFKFIRSSFMWCRRVSVWRPCELCFWELALWWRTRLSRRLWWNPSKM